MGRLVITKVGSAPPELEPGEQIGSVTKLVIDPNKQPPPRFDITVADAREKPTGPKEGYENIDTMYVSPHPSKLQPGEIEKDSALAAWLIEELRSYHETRGVIEDFKRINPDEISAQEVNQMMLRIRGKGWGKWKDPDGKNLQGLELSLGDLLDQKTLSNSFVDQVTIFEWWLNYRKKRLKNCIRYAEQPDFTLESFKLMNQKLTEETIASVPQPAALMSEARTTIKEAQGRPDQIGDLLHKTLAAKEALFTAMNDLGESVAGFKKISDTYASELHAFKSSVILDLGAARKEMADVRKFFLEKEHITEIERLKEFLDLCDRFKKLKDSGVLDVITDVILKLEGA